MHNNKKVYLVCKVQEALRCMCLFSLWVRLTENPNHNA